eukprot:s975_g14.t1
MGPRRDPVPVPDDDDENEEVEETLTPWQVHMLRQEADFLAGGFRPRKRPIQTGKSSSWTAQRTKRERGSSTSAWTTAGHWKGRGMATRAEEDGTVGGSIHHSAKSPNMSWQLIYGKGLKPRSLWRGSQGGKSRAGVPVLHGEGGAASNIRRARAVAKAAQAIRNVEAATALEGAGEIPQTMVTDLLTVATAAIHTVETAEDPEPGRPQAGVSTGAGPMLSISEDSSTATSSTDPTPGMSVNAWVAAGKGKGKWPPMSAAEVQEFWAAKGKGKKGRPHAEGDESDEEGDDERDDEREGGLHEEGEEEEPVTPSSSSPRRILTDPRNQRIAEAIWSGRFAWGDIDESTWESGDAGDQSLPRIPEEESVAGDGEAPSTATATATATETAPSTFETGGSTSMPSSATTQMTGPPSTTLAPSSPAPEPLPTTSTASVVGAMGMANEMPNDEGGLVESPETLSVPAGHAAMAEPVRDEGVGTNLPVPAEAEPSEEEEGEGGDGSGIPLEVQHEWRVAANLPGADQQAEPAPEGTLDPLPVASSATSAAEHPGEDRDETGADPGEDREEETLPHPRIHQDPQHEAPPGDRRDASRSRSPITPPEVQPKRMPRPSSSPTTTAVAVRINGTLVGWFLYREPETRQDYAAMVLRVVTGGLPKSAEVRFDNPDDALEALARSNGSLIHGYQVSVELDPGSMDQSKLRVAGLPPGMQWQEVKDHFSQFGRVGFAQVRSMAG